jgi:hypothetical protein
MRILVTGSRDWTDVAVIDDALREAVRGVPADEVVIVHGDCPTGADAIVDMLALASGFTVEKYPAQWEVHGKAAGPIRNAKMVEDGADVCLAFPQGVSRGTRGCIELAKVAGIETLVSEL